MLLIYSKTSIPATLILQGKRVSEIEFATSKATELTETMLSMSTLKINNEQQSFRPLVNGIIDLFLARHVPAAVQDYLFQMVNVCDFLTICQLLKSTKTTQLSFCQPFSFFRIVKFLLAIDLQ